MTRHIDGAPNVHARRRVVPMSGPKRSGPFRDHDSAERGTPRPKLREENRCEPFNYPTHTGTSLFRPKLSEAAIDETDAFAPDLVAGDLTIEGRLPEFEEAKGYVELRSGSVPLRVSRSIAGSAPKEKPGRVRPTRGAPGGPSSPGVRTVSENPALPCARHGPQETLPADENGLIFALENGELLDRRLVTIHRFKPLLRGAGLPEIRFRDLRHTCATLLLPKNVNLKVVSEMLGHASIAITLDTYSHVLPDMQDSAAKAMENALL